jgi:general secretion pathway protein G
MVGNDMRRGRRRFFRLIAPFTFLFCAIAVAQNGPDVEKARVLRAQTDIHAIQNSLDLFRRDHSKYPTTEQGLDALVREGYLSLQPIDPWGHWYQYQFPGTDGRDYDVISFGRDGKPGGDGFDADISN